MIFAPICCSSFALAEPGSRDKTLSESILLLKLLSVRMSSAIVKAVLPSPAEMQILRVMISWEGVCGESYGSCRVEIKK